jgi:hypothetical protein
MVWRNPPVWSWNGEGVFGNIKLANWGNVDSTRPILTSGVHKHKFTTCVNRKHIFGVGILRSRGVCQYGDARIQRRCASTVILDIGWEYHYSTSVSYLLILRVHSQHTDLDPCVVDTWKSGMCQRRVQKFSVRFGSFHLWFSPTCAGCGSTSWFFVEFVTSNWNTPWWPTR